MAEWIKILFGVNTFWGPRNTGVLISPHRGGVAENFARGGPTTYFKKAEARDLKFCVYIEDCGA